MDVLRPPVVWINGRCYRKLPFEKSSESTSDPYQEPQQANESSRTVTVLYEDEVCDDLVEETSKGFKSVLDIPSALYKFVIGRGGETKKRIEGDTDTRIFIPSQGEIGDIVITGPHKAGVLSARSRIVVIAESSRQKIPFTHFLSFPLYFDELAERTADFKNSVLEQLGQNKAATFLSSCFKDLIRQCLANKPVSVRLQGVEYMNDDPSSVNVLYAQIIEVDGTKRLQHLADSVVERFVDHGIMQREYDRVKLHATLMNSKLHSDLKETRAQDGGKKRQGPPRCRYSFDARDIVEIFKDFEFGEYHLKEIHISERGSYDALGRYKSASSIPLP
ncbi:hypothetical protein QZH41_014471 [Actinostola sp. cb2023]|nr:hypothetical protein QZH41_014471 [Actinostola sp. cb2023]